VQIMDLGKDMLAMAMGQAGEKAEMMKEIDAMRIIAIEEATSDQIAIANKLMKDGVDGFDVLVDASEDGEDALILTQGDDKVINKMLIFAIAKSEVAVVLLEGKIDPSNATKIANIGR